MRLIPFAVVTVLLLGLVASASAQGPKIGYVDDQRLRGEYKAFVDAQEQWNVESVAWEEEAASKQQELQTLIEEYEKQKLILSDEKRREREAAIRAKEEALDAYTRQIYGPGGSGEKLQNRLMTPIIEKLNTAIEAVSIELNYDLVFNSQGLVYAKDGLDMTDKVLEYLEEHDE
ncbi:MAG: OmpH family outer membrane protein [candidate division Zixibacteria bacterium]|nr:OmpH family outer membrane protein [candidate division Zixibacteria bacterium]